MEDIIFTNTIYDRITSSECIINISDNSNKQYTIIVKNCLFNNIDGRVMFVKTFPSQAFLSYTCFYHIESEGNNPLIRFLTDNITNIVTSASFCRTKSYISQFHHSQIHQNTNFSHNTITNSYVLVVQSPNDVICNRINFVHNKGSDIFGISHPEQHNLKYQMLQSNFVDSKSEIGKSRNLLHVNLPQGSMTLQQCVLFRNEPNIIFGGNAQIIFNNCWADKLEFQTGAENSGIVYEYHSSFAIEVWNIPGCQFHTSGNRSPSCPCKRRNHTNFMVFFSFILNFS